MSLRELIDAVDAGAISTDLIINAFGVGWTDIHVLSAFDGNLDAAKALHDALLPGWEWACLWRDGGFSAGVSKTDLPSCKTVCHHDDNPARAWLLAILRAMEAEKPE